jgi:hypothetical protein
MTTDLSDNDRALLAHEVAADEHDKQWPFVTSYGELPRESFVRGWDAAMEYVEKQRQNPTEDYYTLAETRLIADCGIIEYGSLNQRLISIAELIDRKRPELKPRGTTDGQR